MANATSLRIPLTDKYRPRTIADFVGIPQPKKVLASLMSDPSSCAFTFVGESGTGKTSMALALAESMPAELHHIPSQECNVDRINAVYRDCFYVPMLGCKAHIVLVDEADHMSKAAQLALLSKLDALPPDTIFIFTCNSVEGLNDEHGRFLSRAPVLKFSNNGIQPELASLLELIWAAEAPAGAKCPASFATIAKEHKGNVRASINALRMYLMAI